jgi:hypothetical protein
MTSRHGRYLTAILACSLLACGAREEEADASDTAAVAVGAQQDTSIFVAAPERETLPSARIYYTLTQHEWYARGQPLLHENRAYHQAGMPVAASVPEMEQLGEYQGVEYYARRGDTSAAVYVPVFEGYWQPFRADTTRANN